MKQVLIAKGRGFVADIPAPLASPGRLLIRVVRSCLSSGTELAGLAQSGTSLVRRAIEQPKKIASVVEMVKTHGVSSTYQQVQAILNSGAPVGYSLSGVVAACGEGVGDLRPGDRVAAAGAGLANHAQYVDVPRNLVIPMPPTLGFDEAATVTLGGIAMQGVRRVDARLGEFVLVLGAGVLGQLAAQMLAASGARVLVSDVDPKRLEEVSRHKVEMTFQAGQGDVVREVMGLTGGRGVDAVLFCAATNEPKVLRDAFAMTRKKGRVVMVGVWGDTLDREAIYAKELDFLISTSYGPGRYDESYELRGQDYPYAYVRWTEGRNMQEYLRLLAQGAVSASSLVRTKFPVEQAEQAFAALASPGRPLTVLLDYGDPESSDDDPVLTAKRGVARAATPRPGAQGRVRVGVIGAGTFAVGTHLPNLSKLKDRFAIRAICNRTGASARNTAEQFKADYSTTDYREVLADPDIDLVMICTRHDRHGPLVLESLTAGKHTFVEKPLCVRPQELLAIQEFFGRMDSQTKSAPLLMPGFNRRFSKYTVAARRCVKDRINPLFITYRMNAGHIPPGHWVHTAEGGGRIVGEACHIVDLLSFLVASPVQGVGAVSLTPATASVSHADNKSAVLEYEDGSVASIHYCSIGATSLPKERMEVHFDEKSLVLENYTDLIGFGVNPGKLKSAAPDKGFMEELTALHDALLGKTPWPISLESMVETTEITFALRGGPGSVLAPDRAGED